MANFKRVKIKCTYDDESLPGKKEELLKLLLAKTILVADISKCYGGLKLLIIDDASYDKIFSNDMLISLTQANFSVHIPPELNCRKSVIIKNVQALHDYDVDHIRECINNQQEWAKATNVIRFPKSNTYKIQFETTEMAIKACRDGIKINYLSIANHQIEPEQYIPLTVCFKCYAIEDHTTKDCTKDRDYKICSLCATEGHMFYECTAPPASHKCILCEGTHSCMAMKCPQRKQALKIKRAQLNANKRRQDVSYANKTNNSLITTKLNGEMAGQILNSVIMCEAIRSDNPNQTYQNLMAYNGLTPSVPLVQDTALQVISQTLESLLQTPLRRQPHSPTPPPQPHPTPETSPASLIPTLTVGAGAEVALGNTASLDHFPCLPSTSQSQVTRDSGTVRRSDRKQHDRKKQ